MWSVMNSLNIVSRLTSTPPPSPPRSRTSSSANIKDDARRESSSASSGNGGGDGNGGSGRGAATLDIGVLSEKLGLKREAASHSHSYDSSDATSTKDEEGADDDSIDEKTPLLHNNSNSINAEGGSTAFKEAPGSRIWAIPRRVSHAILHGMSVVYATITAPGRYVIACFYDEQGHFSAIMPLRNFKNLFSRRRRKPMAHQSNNNSHSMQEKSNEEAYHGRRGSSRRSPSVDSNASSSSALSSEGEEDQKEGSPARHTRSKTAAAQTSSDAASAAAAVAAGAAAPQKRSIKIKAHNEEVRKRRAEKAARQQQQQHQNQHATSSEHVAALANSLKSPSSPISINSTKTRYPRAPVPPRPLVPRRQPSFTLTSHNSTSSSPARKTLVIDLDETLIHSMAKGVRMSTGHMVEVRLNGPVQAPAAVAPGVATQTPVSLGTGVPILYSVHERPNCHEFLRKVAKWYNLVVFTASVQEYADPVIDWLERERKYFSGRLYRQHCTFRNGSYIKDLAQVEPDLSRVMILDNSPISYLFHDDNAIPIEGWLSDPTDMDLLHLIPMLEALQYATDVRALLSLRKGQAQQA